MFKYELMSDIKYLNEIIDDKNIKVGKAGKKINKNDLINNLSILKEDIRINIYILYCCIFCGFMIYKYI